MNRFFRNALQLKKQWFFKPRYFVRKIKNGGNADVRLDGNTIDRKGDVGRNS